MELIIKIDSGSSVDSITNAISKIKGVISISKVRKMGTLKKNSRELPPNIANLMGCVSFTKDEIKGDPKLAHILSK